jgi:hypothetical protein
MQAYRIETVVEKDGSLVLREIPVRAGEQVEVIVLVRDHLGGNEKYPLRGQPIRYDNPTGPIAESDWEALR